MPVLLLNEHLVMLRAPIACDSNAMADLNAGEYLDIEQAFLSICPDMPDEDFSPVAALAGTAGWNSS